MQQQQQQTIALEAFEASLRGTNMLWYLLDRLTVYPPGFTDQIFADGVPFARRLLITSSQTPPGWRLADDYDLIFRCQTGIEWSVLLTYITNAPKPMLIICAPFCTPPPNFLQRVPQTATLVAFAYMNQTAAQLSIQNYSSILLPPLSLDNISSISFPNHLGIPNPSWNQNSVLRDLHGAGASLVVSSVGDRTMQKQYYWYYTSKNQHSAWTLQQVQSILGTLSSQV